MKENTKKVIIYLAVFVLLLVLVYMISNNNKNDQKISYTEFITKVEAGEVAEIDVLGDTVRIRMKEDGVDEDDFPKEIDYFCTYMSVDQLVEFVDTYNADPLNEDNIIEATYKFKGESVLVTILPYLSVGIMIIFGFIIFKNFVSANNKGMTFSRSKAKMVVTSKIRFTDVAGADEEKEELRELVEFLKTPQRFIALGARIPKGVLLVGPPGTGKTLLAKAVAGESNVPFFSISGSDFVEMYVGVGASRVRDLFDQAKKHAPCLIFIDEIDAVGRQRGAGLGGGSDEREQTLNQLLVELDGFESNEGIIVLAATNRSDILDPALMRPGRFDRQVYVHMPDVKGREEIIKIHARNKPMDSEVDFKRVARLTSGMSGADIENLLNEAAILAARDNRLSITMVDITEGINKVLMGPQKKSRLITPEDKKITAIHEGGHAIVAHSLPMCDKVQEISIVPRGDAGGYTLTLDEKDATHITKEKLLQTITMILGGRAAESIVMKDVTTGASNDMQRATEIARRMVAEWGMSDDIGLVSLNHQSEIFVGRDYQKQIAYSENIASILDKEIKKIIDSCFENAKKIIKEKQSVLDGLVSLLLKKETIYTEEFDLLYNGTSVEEIIKVIDRKEKQSKKRQKTLKKQAEQSSQKRDFAVRLQTAEALFKAGVITEKDFEKVKNDVKVAENEQKDDKNSDKK
ncbi:MAG: ATP-dependent zinc metalloprotease FtsH [Clostridia bacterium]|nr:ATP-dependent zinc metalloprotease FtsH [Clostridia bacterium]